MELVAIAIPTFNGAEFLESALHSVCCQIYRNFVVVISDDDSTDRTLTIIKDFQEFVNFPVYILSHSRLGLVGNWNYCIEFIQTNLPQIKYLKFLFQDDILTPDCLEQMVKTAEQNHPIGLVFCRRFIIGEIPNSLAWLKNVSAAWGNLKAISKGLDYFADPNFLIPPDNKIGEPTNVLIPMTVFDRVGKFDPNLQQFCDLEMWFRIMANFDLAFIDRELAGFRIHPQQTTWVNAANDRVWSEIYAVWCKLLVDSCYQPIPRSVKNKIFSHVFLELGQECFRIIKHRRMYRFPTVLFWLTKFIYARLIPSS